LNRRVYGKLVPNLDRRNVVLFGYLINLITKLMPRPFHPQQDIGAQNAFKKTAFLVL